MRQILFALQFKGRATPADEGSGVLKVTTAAPSGAISTLIGPDGVTGSVQPATGGSANFESEATLSGENTFQEAGTIRFGEGGHLLRFTTVGQGTIGPSAEPTMMQGAVTWQVSGGEGQFAGAGGVITSNFTVSEAGEVTDYQLGVIFVAS